MLKMLIDVNSTSFHLPTIKLSELLFFIEDFWFLSFSTKRDIDLFKNVWGYSFPTEESIEIFRIMLLLHLEGVMHLQIDKAWNDEFGKALALEKFFGLFKEEEWFVEKWKNRLFWFKTKSSVDIRLLYESFGELRKHIKSRKDWFFGSVYLKWYLFLQLFFQKIYIERCHDDIYKQRSILELYQKIHDQIGDVSTSEQVVIVRYSIMEYIENNPYVFAFLSSLEKKRLLDIEEVLLEEEEIIIKLTRFKNFSSQEFYNFIDSKIFELSFKDGETIVNGISFSCKKNTKYGEFLKLFSLLIEQKANRPGLKQEEKYYLPIWEIYDGYSQHKDKFLSLEQDWLVLENIRKSYIDSINDQLQKQAPNFGVKEKILDIKWDRVYAKKP